MTTLREAAQQALEALEFMADEWGFTQKASRFERWRAIEALRAALAQQEKEPQYTTGHCKERAKPNGCQLHNLHCGYPECDRKPAALAQEKEAIAQNLQSRLDAALLLEERRQEIAQPRRETEQEPVAWMLEDVDKRHFIFRAVKPVARGEWETLTPLYTTPPRREWQSLTEDEIRRMGNETPGQQGGWNLAFARAVEAKLKEKNA